MSKSALITGVTGQDGSYLAEWLLGQGYRVYGLVRRSSSPNVDRIRHLLDKITLIPGDLLDDNSLVKALEQSAADEVYNLAAQSFVATSWNQPIFTAEVTGVGVARLLEAIRKVNPKIRMFQASSSEQYGAARTTPQNEETPFHPRSPYAVAKAYAHYITINYRESYGLFACCGISFNHESPRRGLEFVTRKITHAAARIKLGLQSELKLGNLRAVRDWGFAGDYVRGMWSMLQQPQAEEFVFATGECHSVEELVATAFEHAGLDWKQHVVTEASLLRPADVEHLRGDATKAREKLGWRPATPFQQLVHKMVDADLQQVRAEMLAGAARG
ncbi:MAG: GDP-mannose 4,6-dehydratase [Acidobacteria bacterium]|nr:GDP-mannose 4,6-dehydratase [Acidobacteriota bacterium]MCL5286660.1 GDP-mannose 4,6-dehydratase [Acidobacteriota bacterium]